jgi:hypothetical protein
MSEDAAAAAELLRRREIRRSMVEWARACGFEPALHHRLLCTRLEGVARGEIRKLMFFLPPGSAKSTYCNLWVPWFMSRAPGKSVLGASHTTDLAERFSRRIRGRRNTAPPSASLSATRAKPRRGGR